MATVTFDTFKFVKTLKETGMSEAQAEAISTAVRESHQAADLATKADLREYESAIRGDLEKLDTGLRSDMEKLEFGLKAEIKSEVAGVKLEIAAIKGELLLLKWMGGLIVAGVASLMLKAFF